MTIPLDSGKHLESLRQFPCLTERPGRGKAFRRQCLLKPSEQRCSLSNGLPFDRRVFR